MANLTSPIALQDRIALHQEADIRQFSLVIDEPARIGGTKLSGTGPVEKVLTGHAGCLNMMAHEVAGQLNIKLNKLSIDITGRFDSDDTQNGPFDENTKLKSVNVNFQIYTNADKEKVSMWQKIIESRCMDYNGLTGQIPVYITISQFASVY